MNPHLVCSSVNLLLSLDHIPSISSQINIIQSLIDNLLFFMVISPFEYVPGFSHFCSVYCVYSYVSFFFCQHHAHEQCVSPCSSSPSFSLFYSIPLFKYTPVYISLWIDHWVVPSLGSLQVTLMNTFFCMSPEHIWTTPSPLGSFYIHDQKIALRTEVFLKSKAYLCGILHFLKFNLVHFTSLLTL